MRRQCWPGFETGLPGCSSCQKPPPVKHSVRKPLPYRLDLYLEPIDCYFFFERSELWIAGDESGFFFFGQRGREGIGQADFEAGFKIGGSVSERSAGGIKLDRQTFQNFRRLLPGSI